MPKTCKTVPSRPAEPRPPKLDPKTIVSILAEIWSRELFLEDSDNQARKNFLKWRREVRTVIGKPKRPAGRPEGRISAKTNIGEAFALWAAVDVLGQRKGDVLRHWVKRSTDKADYNWLDYRLKLIRECIRQRPEDKAELIALLGDGDVSSKKKRLKALL
jgi:hypothetical protein